MLATWRLLRCNPWSHGGVDYVEDARRCPEDERRIERSRPQVLAFSSPLQPLEHILQPVLDLAARVCRPRLGVVDRRPDDHRPDRARPADGAADPLDAEPAGARAGDEGDPAEVEARQAAAERRADEVLQGEQDQPGGVVPADRRPDPGLHLALPRAAPLRATRAADYGGSLDWLHLVDITEPVRHGWGPLLLVIYVLSQLSSWYMSTTMQGAQRWMLMVLPVVFVPVPDQLPVRPDDLLADDEPVDDGPGRDHAPADPEARAARRSGARARLRKRSRQPASGNGAPQGSAKAGAGAAGRKPSPARRGASSESAAAAAER